MVPVGSAIFGRLKKCKVEGEVRVWHSGEPTMVKAGAATFGSLTKCKGNGQFAGPSLPPSAV